MHAYFMNILRSVFTLKILARIKWRNHPLTEGEQIVAFCTCGLENNTNHNCNIILFQGGPVILRG